MDAPPWDWPSDAGKMFQKILNDSRAQESDRLIAAELAGDSTVINNDLADALMAIVRDAEEPEKLRTRAQEINRRETWTARRIYFSQLRDSLTALPEVVCVG
jgi:hypothetical protein